MNTKKELIEKFHEAANLMVCDIRTARNYGTDYLLSYSDLSFLKCVERNEKTKAGDISKYLGMTNGAVNQLAKKLEKNGFLEAYRIEGNRKEVYYRLTKNGKTACQSFDAYNANMNGMIEDYIADLEEETLVTITGLFDTILTQIAKDKACYMKCDDENENKSDGRCEKCKRTY
ncbi:MAG: hypothetical protein PWP24_272 [Clostridiales bacterium]|nr:hypothetical protein [Clostridiales bacterium]